jgi:hypothetical protein
MTLRSATFIFTSGALAGGMLALCRAQVRVAMAPPPPPAARYSDSRIYFLTDPPIPVPPPPPVPPAPVLIPPAVAPPPAVPSPFRSPYHRFRRWR